MKHIFIVNPQSGSGDVSAEIRAELEKTSFDWEIYVTNAPLDATQFVRERCASDGSEIRFYACGGDGTLNEVVNGAAEFSHASVSCYPCGSGNDFVKYYGGAARFRSIVQLCSAENILIDLIRVNSRLYSINIVNFGFDAYAVKTMNSVRRKPVIGGRNAYNTGVIAAVLHAMKNHARVAVDGKPFHDGDFLLCTLANGKYIGGKYLCAPRSVNDDGAMELCLVKPLSILKFASLIGKYERGEHLDSEEFMKYIEYAHCQKVEIDADEDFILSLDGEICEDRHFMVEIMPKALKFGVPRDI